MLRPILRPTLLVALLFLFLSVPLEARDDARQPNVVLIISDDQAWTDFGFMGHEVIRTPRLDRLASESAVFTDAYVPTSLCRASLATLITGLYPHQHKVCSNDPPDGVDRSKMLRFIREAPSLPRILGEAGYASLQTGKWWEGRFSNGGFTEGMTTRGRHGGPGLAVGRKTMQPIRDFLDDAGNRPFFLWYAPMMPHNPHDPPRRLLRKYAVDGRPPKLARYYAMCEWFDETCGELLDMIDEKGLRENTLVIFIVDNGWIQQTGSRRTTRGWFAPKSKLSPYDGGVRTPLLIRWPGRVEPGRREGLVSSIDLAPTILDACGLEPAASMNGRNLLEVLAGEASLDGRAVFGELFVHTARNIEKPAANLTHRWVRRGRWKLILPEEGAAELYDLEKDPLEEQDLASDHPERVRKLRALIHGWWSPEA